MRVLVYGAGAVGLGLAAFLVKAGASADVLTRPAAAEALRREGLFIEGLFGEFHIPPGSLGVYTSLDDITIGEYNIILVATKTFDAEAAGKDIRSHPVICGPECRIVLCQNGWGNAELFSAYFPKPQIYSARIITGFVRPRPNRVAITVHADAMRIGSLFLNDPVPVEILSGALCIGGLPCETSPDIAKDLWAKMLYNCALNPLSAVFELPYGVLGQHEDSRLLMEDIITEAFAVMRAAGFRTHWPAADDFLRAFYKDMLPPTAGHHSSTFQDIRSKKPTEIDALNGIIVKLGADYSVDVPVNRSIYRIVKFIEEKNLAETVKDAKPNGKRPGGPAVTP